MGIVYSMLDQYNDSLDCFDEMLNMDPDDLCAWYNKGLVFKMIEETQEALKCFDKALDINPNFENAKKFIDELLEGKKKC